MKTSFWLRSTRAFLQILIAASLVMPPHAFAGDKVYDVSGPDGKDDRDGTSYNNSAGTASNGRDGGDAEVLKDGSGRLVKKGWDGGSLNLTLAVPNDGKNIQVKGTQVGPEQQRGTQVLDSVPLKSTTNFHFLAGGGKGGKGGDGGRGQDGGTGTRGADATQYSSGGNGGTGGDGGDEGDSTSGGDAGRGGKITIRVGIQDNDLAMAFQRVDVSGNTGGAAGSGRGAGSGGAGGAGGGSHTWYTTETRTVTKYRDVDDGQGGTRSESYSDTESYQESHTNPGGFPGSSGSNGRRSSKVVYNGRDSEAGQFVYEIVDEKGKVTQYERPYDLTLIPDYKLIGDLNNNGFFEPGETITIKGLTVMNSGKSPTPKYQKIILYLSDSKLWIHTHKIELTLPKVLNPGEGYTFDKEVITFNLNELKREEPGLLRSKDVVGPQARVTRIERDFKNCNDGAQTTIKVQNPIQITPLDSLLTLAPGEAAKVYFKIKNISQQTIGKMPNLDARTAQHIVRRVGGNVDLHDFVLATNTEDPTKSPAEGIARAIEGLKPDEERIIETIVGFQPTAGHYKEAIIQPELYLQSILQPNQQNLIQFEPFNMRVSQVFEYHADADVLLIANHNLDDKALEALKVTAAVKQLKMDVWDFSYYGFFNFSNKLQDYENMFNGYRGKTIVILGNEIKSPVGNERVSNLVSPDVVIEAARRFGIKIVVIDTSENPQQTVERLTEPTPLRLEDEGEVQQVRDYPTAKAYLKELARTIHEVQEDRGNSEAFLGIERMQVTQWRMWGKPTRERLRNKALNTLDATHGLVPEAQYFVDYEFKPEIMKKSFFGLFKKWRVGNLNIRRSVDDSKTSVVAIKMDAGKIDDPNFIMSDEFQTAFDLSMNFSTKLKLLNAIILGEYAQGMKNIKLPEGFTHVKIPEPMAVAEILVHTILLDILHEQLTVRPIEFTSQVLKKELWDKLDLLKKLTHYDYTQFKLDPASQEGQLFVNLISQLRFFSKGSLSFWQTWFTMFSSKNREVSQVTDEMLNRLVETVFENADQAKKLIDEHVQNGRKAAKENGVKRTGLLAFLDPRNLRQAVVRDGEVNGALKDRVRSADRQKALLEQSVAQQKRNAEVRVAIEAHNARLRLSAADCQKLLEKAKGNK